MVGCIYQIVGKLTHGTYSTPVAGMKPGVTTFVTTLLFVANTRMKHRALRGGQLS
jgi:hypothetical protein